MFIFIDKIGDMLNINEAVAAEVRASASRQKVQHKELAVSSGIAYGTLARKLSGRSAFTADELVRIATALNVQPATLLPATTSDELAA